MKLSTLFASVIVGTEPARDAVHQSVDEFKANLRAETLRIREAKFTDAQNAAIEFGLPRTIVASVTVNYRKGIISLSDAIAILRDETERLARVRMNVTAAVEQGEKEYQVVHPPYAFQDL